MHAIDTNSSQGATDPYHHMGQFSNHFGQNVHKIWKYCETMLSFLAKQEVFWPTQTFVSQLLQSRWMNFPYDLKWHKAGSHILCY